MDRFSGRRAVGIEGGAPGPPGRFVPGSYLDPTKNGGGGGGGRGGGFF